MLRALAVVGITWDLRKPSAKVLEEGLRGDPAPFVRVGERAQSVPLLPVAVPADAE